MRLLKLSHPHSQWNFKKQKQKQQHFDPSWVQRIDGVACMIIEDYFGILLFLVHFNCDCGNTQID